MREAMLTTFDNPFDPFEDFDSWFAFDTSHGYNSCGLLARVVVTSDELSSVDQAAAVEEGIDIILQYNLSGMHRKVVRETSD